MSLRDWLLPFQTQPEHVGRAPRRERIKRDAWMIGSTLFTLTAAAMPLSVLASMWGYPDGILGIVIGAAWFGGSLWASQPLFEWGVERFDLVLPWQFREAAYADKTGGET